MDSKTRRINTLKAGYERLSKGEQTEWTEKEMEAIKRMIDDELAPKPAVKKSSDNSGELRRRKLLFEQQAKGIVPERLSIPGIPRDERQERVIKAQQEIISLQMAAFMPEGDKQQRIRELKQIIRENS